MTLRIAVLGVGRIGKMHAELVARRVPGAALAMVQDINADAAAAVGEQFDVPFTTHVDEVLGSSDVDAVAICSSTDTHVPLMIAAAHAGKAILCEKPISLELDKVDSALAVIENSGVPIQVGFNRRFDAAHASVRAAVVDGSIGDLHILRITSRDPAPPPIEYISSDRSVAPAASRAVKRMPFEWPGSIWSRWKRRFIGSSNAISWRPSSRMRELARIR